MSSIHEFSSRFKNKDFGCRNLGALIYCTESEVRAPEDKSFSWVMLWRQRIYFIWVNYIPYTVEQWWVVVQDFREPTIVFGRLVTHIAFVCSSVTELDSCHHLHLGFTSWVQLHLVPSTTLTHSLTKTSFCMPTLLGRGRLSILRLVPTRPKSSSKDSTRFGALRMSFIDVAFWKSLEIGNVNVCR